MKKFLGWALILALAFALGMFVREYVAGVADVAGDSMYDTLITGDKVLISRLEYALGAPERGDIAQIALSDRGGLYLKRVIGLPGETVELIDGAVHINGHALTEPYILPSDDDFYIELSDNEYFVLGDNRPVSYDSREEDFGVVDASCFRGRVRAILWPFDRIQFGIE